jgi:hypothetical protein
MSILKDFCDKVFCEDAAYIFERGNNILADIKSSVCTSFRRNIDDYCSNENNCMVSVAEFDAWCKGIDELNCVVAELEIKINKILDEA